MSIAAIVNAEQARARAPRHADRRRLPPNGGQGTLGIVHEMIVVRNRGDGC